MEGFCGRENIIMGRRGCLFNAKDCNYEDILYNILDDGFKFKFENECRL